MNPILTRAFGIGLAFGSGLIFGSIYGAHKGQLRLEEDLKIMEGFYKKRYAINEELKIDDIVEAAGSGKLDMLLEVVEEEVFEEATEEDVADMRALANDYNTADTFVSIIDEEEYLEDDGRIKKSMDIIMDEYKPIFRMDGEEVDDWDAHVGSDILVDFYKLIPPGAESVLYVRNHHTSVDYEVVLVEP